MTVSCPFCHPPGTRGCAPASRLGHIKGPAHVYRTHKYLRYLHGRKIPPEWDDWILSAIKDEYTARVSIKKKAKKRKKKLKGDQSLGSRERDTDDGTDSEGASNGGKVCDKSSKGVDINGKDDGEGDENGENGKGSDNPGAEATTKLQPRRALPLMLPKTNSLERRTRSNGVECGRHPQFLLPDWSPIDPVPHRAKAKRPQQPPELILLNLKTVHGHLDIARRTHCGSQPHVSPNTGVLNNIVFEGVDLFGRPLPFEPFLPRTPPPLPKSMLYQQAGLSSPIFFSDEHLFGNPLTESTPPRATGLPFPLLLSNPQKPDAS